ncbi:MAG: hypothetical protein U1E65_09545 [Myxococcota bacterium]
MSNGQAKTSTLAIVALVFAFICMPVGLILGLVALIRINNSQGELGGRGLAIAAMIIPAAMVPVIGILAAIAVPNFVRYQLRSKEAEAKVNLRAILQSQRSFHDEHAFYAQIPPSPSGAPSAIKQEWEARGCPAECSKDQPGSCGAFECVGFSPDLPVYFQYSCSSSENGAGVLCAAVGDLDGDGKESVHLIGEGAGPDALREPLPEIVRTACRGKHWGDNELVECTPNVF